MDQWRKDGTLKPQVGQEIDDDVLEQLRDCMPPHYSNYGYFQPGEAYSHDFKTGRALYMTFNGNEYIGIKPSCSLWLGKKDQGFDNIINECVRKVINETVSKELAQEIIRQLGGNRFVAMTGAKDFVAIDYGLRFRIGRNKSSANIVKIKLDIYDTYTMEFWRTSNFNPYKLLIKYTEQGLSSDEIKAKIEKAEENSKPKKLKEYNGLYCDQLQEFFTEYTGLYTRL